MQHCGICLTTNTALSPPPQEVQRSHRQQAAHHSQGHRSTAGDQVHHRGGHVRYDPMLLFLFLITFQVHLESVRKTAFAKVTCKQGWAKWQWAHRKQSQWGCVKWKSSYKNVYIHMFVYILEGKFFCIILKSQTPYRSRKCSLNPTFHNSSANDHKSHGHAS